MALFTRFIFCRVLLPGLLLSSCSAQQPHPLAEKLKDFEKASVKVFQLRDHRGHGLDCLEVFQPKLDPAKRYFGLSHCLRNGVFSVHLSRSHDLKKWEHLKELDHHGSQATIHETKEGAFLMAYEKDAPNSCWIRIRHYPDLTSLIAGKHSREIDLPRTLAPTAEGTPSFEDVRIDNSDLSKSKISLRFHYFQNTRVDQLARGTLTNFRNWRTTPSSKLNRAFVELGGNGNLGDRSKFTWKNKFYYLQEVQSTRLDWGSWGIFLCDKDGLPLKDLQLETARKSTAFSNPAVSVVKNRSGKDLLVFSAFLHSKGSAPGEAGQMLIALNSP